MRILITGGAGFIGHHVVEHFLKSTDWHIALIDRLDCSGNLNRLSEIGAAKNPRVRFVFHDLRGEINEHLASQVGTFDYIIHLAAATHVDRSIENPVSFVQDNVLGTCHLLDFARRSGVSKFIYFGTDEVFGPAPPGVAYKEDDRYRSGNPYAATKAGAEELALSYQNTYGVPIIVTHTMNVIGRRQHPEKYLPMTISKVMKGEKVTVHATPDKKKAGSRYYIHAPDVAEALHVLLLSGKVGQKYNIVGEREIDNLELAQMVARACGKPLSYELVDFHSSRPGHDTRYALCGDKMKREFGFIPQRVSVAIPEIVEWSLKNPQWLAGV